MARKFLKSLVFLLITANIFCGCFLGAYLIWIKKFEHEGLPPLKHFVQDEIRLIPRCIQLQDSLLHLNDEITRLFSDKETSYQDLLLLKKEVTKLDTGYNFNTDNRLSIFLDKNPKSDMIYKRYFLREVYTMVNTYLYGYCSYDNGWLEKWYIIPRYDPIQDCYDLRMGGFIYGHFYITIDNNQHRLMPNDHTITLPAAFIGKNISYIYKRNKRDEGVSKSMYFTL